MTSIVDNLQWKSSSAYIPCAHEYGKPWQWRSSVRYLGEKYCKEKAWRPSVHSSAPLAGDEEKPYRSQIVVKGGAYTADTETIEGPFKPHLRYIPEFYPNRPPWRPSRAHVCTKKCYHNSPKFEHIYNPVPAFETEQKLPPVSYSLLFLRFLQCLLSCCTELNPRTIVLAMSIFFKCCNAQCVLRN